MSIRYTRLTTLASFLLLGTSAAFAQSSEEGGKTTVSSFLDRTHVGGYGEITLKDPNGSEQARLDIPRFVIYLDHYFSDKWAFKSETEIEHVKIEGGEGGEVALEQAFIDFHASNSLGWRAGLLTIPIGIMNQTHEPTTFYSVDRTAFESVIIPTTWRELGTGIYGDLTEGLKYQFYVTEGLIGEHFSDEGIHEARQEGTGPEVSEDVAGSVASHPALSAKIDVLPLTGLRIGASGYYQAVTHTSLPDDASAPLLMATLDARYEIGGLRLRALEGLMSLGDADKIALTGREVFKQAVGGYIEAAYNLMSVIDPNVESELVPFIRYENFNFRHIHPLEGTTETTEHNEPSTVVTAGVAFKPLDNVILKADYRSTNSEETSEKGRLNLGVGYSF